MHELFSSMKGTVGESRKAWFEDQKWVTEDVTVGYTDTGVNLSGSQAGRSKAQGE